MAKHRSAGHRRYEEVSARIVSEEARHAEFVALAQRDLHRAIASRDLAQQEVYAAIAKLENAAAGVALAAARLERAQDE